MRSAFAFVAVVACVAPAVASEPSTFDCVAEPAQKVQLGSPVVGLISSIEVGRGDFVREGQILARLDSKVEEANVAIAEAQARARETLETQQTRLQVAEAALERSQRLSNSGSVTRSQLEELKATVEIARRDVQTEHRRLDLAALEVERQKALLARQSIVSPIDGFVTSQLLHVGEFVRQDNAIMTLVQTDPLFIETYMPVGLWGRIAHDVKAVVEFDQPPGARENAEVKVIDNIFDAASGTFGVRLELSNPDNAIPAGQRCRVTFDFTSTMATQPSGN